MLTICYSLLDKLLMACSNIDYLLQFARQISGGFSQCWLFVTVARQIVGFFSQCWLFVTVCILNKLLEVYPNLNFLLQFARQIAGGLS